MQTELQTQLDTVYIYRDVLNSEYNQCRIHPRCIYAVWRSFNNTLLANYLSSVYAQNDSGTAASDTQRRLHGTTFTKTYMIAQSLC